MMPIKNLAKNGPVGVLKRCCTIDAARIRALTEAPRIKPTSPRCRSAWQPNPAEAPLIDAEILFRQSGPAQTAAVRTKSDHKFFLRHLIHSVRNIEDTLNKLSGQEAGPSC
jgi:hypothetical protein